MGFSLPRTVVDGTGSSLTEPSHDGCFRLGISTTRLSYEEAGYQGCNTPLEGHDGAVKLTLQSNETETSYGPGGWSSLASKRLIH